MLLFIMHVRSDADGSQRGVSVWVEHTDPDQARGLARAHLSAAGWAVVSEDSVAETDIDDYFRPCPSQQAFTRARAEGVAWRFDDE